MASWKLLLLLGLLCSAQLLRVASAEEEAADAEADVEDATDDDDAEDYADADRAHLLVRKWFKEEKGVQGRNLTVHLEVYNAGTSTATDVSVDEPAAPEGFELIDGKVDATFSKLEVGSKVSYNYTLVIGTAEGVLMFEPAKVTYKADSDGEEQSTISTVAYIEVLTPAQQLQEYLLVGGKYASLGMMRTGRDWATATAILAVLALVFGGNSAVKSYSTARTNVRRKKALASLEKDE